MTDDELREKMQEVVEMGRRFAFYLQPNCAEAVLRVLDEAFRLREFTDKNGVSYAWAAEIERTVAGLEEMVQDREKMICRSVSERDEARRIARALWLTHDGPGSIGGDPDWLVKP